MAYARDPHLSSTFWKREIQNENRAQWQKRVNDMQRQDVMAVKENKWTSEKSFHHSMEAYKEQKRREDGKALLETRKLHLVNLLEEERKAYQREIQSIIRPESARIEEMRDRATGLKSAREEKRRQMAEDKLHEHFRANNPDLREMESYVKEQEAIGLWKDQIMDRQKFEDAQRTEEAYYAELAAAKRQREREEDAEEFQHRIREERAIKDVQRRQIEEIQMREDEARRLRQQEFELLQHRVRLQELEQLRQEELQNREQKEHGRMLLRQHLAALKRKSRQVQDELEADLRLLSALAQQEETARERQTVRREHVKADADWMREMVEDQLRMERAREAELDNMFQDEAAKLWAKREEEWKKEKEARDRLMQDVLQSQQEQIHQRLLRNRQAQEESIEARERLLRQLQEGQRLDAEEAAIMAQERMAAKRALEDQVARRVTARHDAVAQERLEVDEERRAEAAYEEMLRREAERMSLVAVPTKSGRKFLRKPN